MDEDNVDVDGSTPLIADTDIEMQKQPDDDDYEKEINPYIRYCFNFEVMQYFFSMFLTSGVIAFCMWKVSTLPPGSSEFSLYFTPMMALVSLWIPLRGMKTQTTNAMKKITK